MKKQLFGAVLLSAAAFTACSDQEVLEMNNQPTDRKMVENVTFTLNTEETRLEYNGKYVWQANDTIGAVLMDNIQSPNYYDATKAWKDRFTLTDYIHTNYPFVRDAKGEWSGPEQVCEGNYFVVYPYDLASQSRASYVLSADNQDLVVKKGDTQYLKDAYVKNNSFVGYKQIDATKEDEMSAVTLYQVFTAQGMSVKNTGTNSYEIQKVTFQAAGVSDKAVIDPTVSGFEWDPTKEIYTKENVMKALTFDPNPALITVNLSGENVLATQEKINLIMMGYANANLGGNQLMIFTDKGVVGPIDIRTVQTGEYTPLTNVITNRAVTKFGADKEVLDITFDDTSVRVLHEMIINSQEDFEYLLDINEKAHYNGWIAAQLNCNVTITEEIAKKINEGETKVDFDGPATTTVTIEAPVNLAKIYSYGPKLLNKSTLEVNAYSWTYYLVNEGTINAVKKDGLCGSLASINNAKGTINIKDGGYAAYFPTQGTVNVEAKLDAAVTVSADQTVNVNVDQDQNITVDAKGTLNLAGTYTGIFTNNGTVNISGYAPKDNVNNTTDAVVKLMGKDTGVKLATNNGIVDNTVLAPKANVQVTGTVRAEFKDASVKYTDMGITQVVITSSVSLAKDVFDSGKSLWGIADIQVTGEKAVITISEAFTTTPAGTTVNCVPTGDKKVTFNTGTNPMNVFDPGFAGITGEYNKNW